MLPAPSRDELPSVPQSVTLVRERRLRRNCQPDTLHARDLLHRRPGLVDERVAGDARRVTLAVRVLLVVVLGADDSDLGAPDVPHARDRHQRLDFLAAADRLPTGLDPQFSRHAPAETVEGAPRARKTYGDDSDEEDDESQSLKVRHVATLLLTFILGTRWSSDSASSRSASPISAERARS